MARGKRGEGPNKMQLVRDAIEVLGPKAKPLDLQKEIKEKSNLDISTQMISSYKSMLKKPKKAGKNAVGRPAKAPSAAAAAGKTGTITDDVVALKKLMNRLGAKGLRDLIDVLA